MKINSLYVAIIFVFVGVHQMHAMEEKGEGNGKKEMELPLLVSHAHASHGDSEGEEYKIVQLIESMRLEIANADESGPEQADEIRKKIIDELKGNHSQNVCDGKFDTVLCQLSSYVLSKEPTGNVEYILPTSSVSLCSRSNIMYSKPYQKVVEIKTEGGMVRASILPERSAIRIQRLDCDEENVDIQIFNIDTEFSCLAINKLLDRITYVKKDVGIFYRDLCGDSREMKAQEVTGDSWVAVLALSPSGEKLAYCLAKKVRGNFSGEEHTYTGSDEAFVYDIPSKILIKLDRYDLMAVNPRRVFVYVGLPTMALLGLVGAALGALIGYASTPKDSCKVELENVYYCDENGCGERLECPWGEEDTAPYTRLGAWVGAVADSSLGMLIYLCSAPCNPVLGCCYFDRNISPIGFADDDTVQAQYRYTMHIWDVSTGDVAVEEFKKKCYLQQISAFEEIKIEDADNSTAKLVRTLLSSPMRALLSDDEKEKTKTDIKDQAKRLCLNDLM